MRVAARSVQAIAVLSLIVLAACSGEEGSYFEVAGGGFVFNYRIAEAKYGIALKPMRDIPADAVIEATFDNPSGGQPFVIRKEGPFNPTRVAFDTPPLKGVVKGHPYQVTVILRDGSGAPLQTIEKTFQSELDQTVLPERPLAIGPGYQRNLDESATAYPPSISMRPPRADRADGEGR